MTNILLRLSYVGTHYHGFQVQKNALSVCEVLQDAMQKTLRHRPDVKGCSRTDAGVHARDFALNFRSDTAIPLAKLPLALNSCLPPDIRVRSAQKVPEDFHARYSCQGKEYHYIIRNTAVDDPFTLGFYYRFPRRLDETAMEQAARVLIGRHDFAAFQSAGSTVEDTVRTISKLEVHRQEETLTIRVAADGFLYNMVRILAGTLLQAGQGELSPAGAKAILQSQNRSSAGSTLPAQGLFLHQVFYDSHTLAP